MDTYNQWMILKNEVNACKGCYLTSKSKLLHRGNLCARIMVIGDAPTPEDIKANQILSGNTGKYLDGMLKLIDIEPDEAYITALVNCTTGGKAPKPTAVEACIKCLRKQFQLVKPEIVICLGSIASRQLIDPHFRLERDHGKLITKGKVMFMGTYHPSAFYYNPSLKDAMLGDFIKIKEFCDTYPPYSNLLNV